MSSKRRKPRVSSVPSRFHVIENHQRRVYVPLPELRRFFLRMNREMGLDAQSAFVRLVTDAEMRRLNTQYRHKPKTTDVLSFPTEQRAHPRSLRTRARQLRGTFLGDIAISPTVARRNARAFGRSLSQEICVLMLHGVLHLLGYDHENDRGEMERVEAKLRSRLELN
ncbi:MAG TPA: rRNA maturation RNase YbeY [Candidatus Sulfotelmatobacter sp.]|nr:rRNA maturation RNase YbeY [Candidatus Sulfotelmatobacter sp.]